MDGLIEDLREDGQHLFFEFAMLLLQVVELFFGRVGGSSHAFEEHLNQLIPRLDLSLIKETDEQAITPRVVVDIAHVAHIEGGGLRGKLLNLSVGNLFEEGLCRQD